LSEDGELTLIVLALDPDIVASSRLRDVTGESQKTINDDLAGAQLTARLSGMPVMQLEMRNAVGAIDCSTTHSASLLDV
jgi:hypothetical protein